MIAENALESSSPTEQFPAIDIVDEPLDEHALAERDRLATMVSIGLVAFGFLLMGFGWYGASGKNFIQQQFPYLLSGGLPGLALTLLGGGIIVVRDTRRERQAFEARVAKLEELLEAALQGGATAAAKPAPRRTVAKASTNSLVVLGRTTFHRADCRLVQNKEGLETSPRADAIESGLQPCRVCAP
jgi:hypothetical protein